MLIIDIYIKNFFFVIQKIKPKDLAKFIVTHKGELNTFLNKPQVDEEKACARLLLHKTLQDKYKFIRGRFSNVPIQDLFMSRIERRKMKKEAKEKQKNKKKAKNDKVVNSEGEWNVEDVVMADDSKLTGEDDDEISCDDDSRNEMSGDENDDNEVSGDESDQPQGNDEPVGDSGPEDVEQQNDSEVREDQSDAVEASSDVEVKEKVSNILKVSPKVKPSVGDAKSKPVKEEVVDTKTVQAKEINNKNPPKKIIKKNPAKKQKELNKTKHFNEKIQQKKLKKDSDAPIVENKIVDPFFITSTGENYMSVVEPRAPDEIKGEHFRGNRKLRRAVQFGLVPKSKLRQNNYNNNDRFNKQNGYDRENGFKGKFNDRQNDRRNFNDRKSFNNDFNYKRGFNNRNDKSNDEKPEKLHPSWEAKKKKSGLLPFEGKKIVFDES